MNIERFQHYRTHNDKIDACHFRLLCEMEDVARDYNQFKNISPILVLFNHLTQHHIEEEAAMVIVNYPYIQFHIDAHCILRNNLDDLISLCTANKRITNITDEFERLFVTHIDHYDIQFSDWIKDNAKSK